MHSKSMWKWLVLAIVISTSLALVLPLGKKIRLGLDLRGGYSFAMELDKAAIAETIRERATGDTTDEEIQRRIKETTATADETAVEIIRNRIDTMGTMEPVITRGGDGRIYVQIPGADEAKRKEAEDLMKSVAFLEFRLVHTRSAELGDRLLDSNIAPEGYSVVSINGSKYYQRIDGVAQPAATDLYTFGDPPKTYVFMLEQVRVDTMDAYRPIFVGRRPLLTGDTLSRAGSYIDNLGRHKVTLSFDKEGTRIFADVTTKYSRNGTANRNANGRQLAIILDGIVKSAPSLNEPILGGNAEISGNFTAAEANILRNVLNAGAMPAPLKFIGKRFVNPTLGEDAISGAKKAIVVGFAAVIVFVIFYYRKLGVVAAIALILDLVLLPICAVFAAGILSLFAKEANMSGGDLLKLPVLTLPGIAGILLTIGMAVDANVLIYERTREEQAAGRSPYQSIMAGYDRAFLAIFDGNLTTVITAIILFSFGTGLIRGFSVTLIAGIIASMYTALMVTKMIFQATVKESSTEPIKMMKFLREDLSIPFNKYFKKFAILAVAIIVVTVSITVVRGVRKPSSIFAVDFTGGAKVTYTVANPEKAPLAEIRNALSAAGMNDADPQYQKVDENSHFLEIKAAADEAGDISEKMTAALTGAPELEGAGFTYMDIDSVGSQIGSEMQRSAYIAIILSTLAMLLYITLRFEFGFALGAIAALVHDVLITVGIFACLGFQFDLTIVAAMLTIVGYGVNDTIVLFDRIREELRGNSKLTFPELTNHCINLTLNRTILTSISTMLTVLALVIFTTGNIYGFAVCMLIGLVVSTFSTIFIAAPVMLAWYRNKRPELGATK